MIAAVRFWLPWLVIVATFVFMAVFIVWPIVRA